MNKKHPMYGFDAENAGDFDEFAWKRRYLIVEQLLKKVPKGPILDLGCADCKLKEYIPKGRVYQGVDITSRVNGVIAADFNKREFPYFEGSFGVVCCLGLIEYIDYPEFFLGMMHRYSTTMIITLNAMDKNLQAITTKLRPWQFQRMLLSSGWQIVEIMPVGAKESAYLCKSIF